MFKQGQSGSFFRHRKIQNKISEKHKVITIGFIGTEKGVGVTHTALLVAKYFSKQRGKVAFIEWGDQDAVKMIRRTYEGNPLNEDEKIERTKPYVFRRVHYYENGDDELLSMIRRKGYQIILIDFGEQKSQTQDIYNQMDIRLVVGRGNDWKYHRIESFYQNLSHDLEEKYKDLILILACGTKEEKKHIQHIIKGRIETVSYHKDPFEWTEKMKKEIEGILEL